MNRSCRTRRGSVYIAVVGVAMIVTIMGMCALQISRMQLRQAQNRRDLNEARLLAQTAIEFALGRINLDPNYRNNYSDGNPTAITLGNGTCEFTFTDPNDGVLNDGDNHEVQIRGTGKVNDAIFVYTARYAPGTSGAMILQPGSFQRSTYTYD